MTRNLRCPAAGCDERHVGGSPRKLRVLDTGPGEPAWNMALDDALLRGVGPPTLRLYGWAPPGLSLGWFQDSVPFHAIPGDHRIVRRRTGGGAIYHADEITFALTLDAGLLPGDVGTSYELLHGAVQRALAAVGVATRFAAGGAGCLQPRPRTLWCFAEPGCHDLVLCATGGKLVGSAQRRIRQPRARVLHHGSIPLRTPAATPFAAAVGDVVDPDLAAPALRAALAAEIATALGLVPAAAAPDAGELAAARAALPSFADPHARAR